MRDRPHRESQVGLQMLDRDDPRWRAPRLDLDPAPATSASAQRSTRLSPRENPARRQRPRCPRRQLSLRCRAVIRASHLALGASPQPFQRRFVPARWKGRRGSRSSRSESLASSLGVAPKESSVETYRDPKRRARSRVPAAPSNILRVDDCPDGGGPAGGRGGRIHQPRRTWLSRLH
jgi:hypothetical protein